MKENGPPYCTCAAEASPGSCKHIFAVSYALEEYSRLELYSAPTEKLQAWHQPTNVKVNPVSSQELFGKPSLKEAVGDVKYSALFSGPYNYQYIAVMPDYEEHLASHMPPLPALILTCNCN
ncbi:hypothetical protein JTE90_028609 [Oedothorax gibbosus]|uniref:SWIM-type domain-containing protein n=1 Tax=Oedothorax gibbosus TaxID=931172 RepID=A0AAV6TYR8_9ARAC|nr:hypothetical protein JTE90_028609 [Oedothorax gibbosus]